MSEQNALDKIKSKYIIIILFSHFDEKKKLKVLKYNNRLQKKIDITLNNYKFFSRRYIIYESNNKGKEYEGYTNDLLFEGEYLNGERNGKGKEYYYDGKLEFEGEYLNGKRNGYGKEYYKEGELKFEGIYSKGERVLGNLYNKKGDVYFNLKEANGIIKEYNYSGDIEFVGKYFNGKRNGKGKEYYEIGRASCRERVCQYV